MIFTTWYSVEEKLPTISNWYLSYKEISFGDNYPELKYFYFDARYKLFYESPHSRIYVNVLYWVDVNFTNVPKVKQSPALHLAEQAVIKAIENFETIRNLTN